MSKSSGNFYTLRDLLKKDYDSRAIRYLLITTHYRQQLNFTFKGLKAAEQAIKRLDEFMLKLKKQKIRIETKESKKAQELIKKVKIDFEKYMEDDLDVVKALATIFIFIRETNKMEITKEDVKKIHSLMLRFDRVLGLQLEKITKEKIKISEKIKKLIKEREKARKNKDFKLADKIRNQIKKQGYIIEDTKQGPIIKKL